MDMMLLQGRERGSSVNSKVFFLSKSVFLHCNFKKKTLRGNSERTPTTIVAPHNYECSFKAVWRYSWFNNCLPFYYLLKFEPTIYSKYNKTPKIHSRRKTYELWSIKYIKSPMMDDDDDGWWWMHDGLRMHDGLSHGWWLSELRQKISSRKKNYNAPG